MDRRLALFVTILLFCTLVMPLSTIAQDASGPQPLSHAVIPCPMSIPAGEIEGDTMLCGQLQVPEDWDDPAGRSITLTYAVMKARNQAPFLDPVLYFDGGPGASSLEVLRSLSQDFGRLRETRDVIFYDQRGIRFSSELICPPEVVQNLPEPQLPEGVNIEEIGATIENASLDSDPVKVSEAYGFLSNPATVACAEYFSSNGIDLSEYSTHNSVLDAIALMRSLDYPEYNLYGISYGTTLTQEILRHYDENAGAELPAVRSIVIDGVMPLTADLTYNNAIVGPNVVMDVFSSCEADAACSAQYPNIRQRAIDLLAALDATPLVIDETTTITVDDLRHVLTVGVASRSAAVYLPRLIDELERGQTDVYRRFQDGSLPVLSSESADEIVDPFDAIASETTDVAQQLREAADEIDLIAAQNQRLSDAIASGESIAMVFAKELIGSVEQLGWNDQLSMSVQLTLVLNQPPDRQLFVQLIAHLPESEQQFILGLLAILTEADIAEAHAILQDPAFRIDPQNEIQHNLIQCNDRLSSFDIGATVDQLRAFEAPQLIDIGSVDFAFEAMCRDYGLEEPAAPAPPFVANSSGIPILVVNGALDKATSRIWGGEVYEHLQDAQVLTFPQSEHGATLDSACAKDVTNAFVLSPDGELNTNCIETMRPVFVSPDEPLPTAAA